MIPNLATTRRKNSTTSAMTDYAKYVAQLPPGGWVMRYHKGRITFTCPEHPPREVVNGELRIITGKVLKFPARRKPSVAVK